MSPARTLALMLDPDLILTAQGLPPDPWQRDLLLSTDNSVLLCCSRQAGKSTTVAALAVHTALFRAPALTLILSPSQRQSGETFRKIKDAYNALGRPAGAVVENQSTLELANGSRVVCLPGKEGTVRSFSAVDLLILDEAARVADDLYRTVRPMLAVSNGRLVALSTPFGIGIDPDLLARPPNEQRPSGSGAKSVPFTPMSEVEKAVTAAIAAVDFEGMARRAAEAAWERARGRV